MGYFIGPDARNQPDNRYLPRWKVLNRVSYRLDNGNTVYEGLTKDLNSVGACLNLNENALLAKSISMTIYLDHGAPIEADGDIVWKKDINGQTIAGVQFKKIDAPAQERILDHAFRIDREKFLNHFFKGWKNAF